MTEEDQKKQYMEQSRNSSMSAPAPASMSHGKVMILKITYFLCYSFTSAEQSIWNDWHLNWFADFL